MAEYSDYAQLMSTCRFESRIAQGFIYFCFYTCTMLGFATQFLTIGVTNNQRFAYHFVGNLLLYRKHGEAF